LAESLLLACASRELSGALANLLRRRGYQVHTTAHLEETLKLLPTSDCSLAVVTLPLQGGSLRALATSFQQHGLPFLVTGQAPLFSGAEAFELGAVDYIADPRANEHELLASIGVALGSRRGDVHLRYLRSKSATSTGWSSIVGRSPALDRIVSTLRQVCLRTSSGAAPTILLNGETGTGKGFFARCIHDNSARRNQPYVDVNCATLPPSLMESELFGHERGAFTDAKTARPGLFETADRGTLFLDEIATIPPDLQAKLLKVLEEKQVRRIGGRQQIPVNVQVIAATHENLTAAVQAHRFREDLFHRLNIIAVKIPPLRERTGDILPLAELFLQQLCREYGMEPRQLTPDAVDWMLTYRWPGNVRELRNQIERIVLLENDGWVRAEHFVAASGSMGSTPPPPSARTLPPSVPSLPASVPTLPAPPHPSSNPPASGPTSSPPPGSVAVTSEGSAVRVSLPPTGVPLEELEREVLRQALLQCNGNVSRAARFLSISRQTLIYRMKKYEL
jgi:DNA-binding NtrC family response regulator